MPHGPLRIPVVVLAIVAGSCTQTVTTTTTSASVAPTATTTTTAPTTTSPVKPPIPDAVTLGIGDPVFADLGNPGYDVQHYTLDLTYDPDGRLLSGVVTIDALATDDMDTLNLDFSALEVVGVIVDGNEASFARTDVDVTIAPAAGLVAGEAFTVEVAYRGSPEPVVDGAVPFGIGWRTTTRGTYVVAEPDAARSWFPSNDHPADKATYTFRITVPDGVTAIANGILEDTITDLGWATWVWEMRQPMATYLATVATGPYVLVIDQASSELSGVEIRNALFIGSELPPALDLQGEMLDFFAGIYGPYPFDAYGIVVVEDLSAALETQSISVFGQTLLTSPALERVLVHELAHQWFGDLVSPATWRDIWLTEGFASYGEWLWTEHRNGRDALERGITQERDRLATGTLPPPGSPPDDDLFNLSVYRVGAMTLHALRLEIGDDAFFETLQSYLEQFRFSVASTADFITVAEQVSGENLAGFFDAWLFKPDIPQFPTG